MGTHRERHVSSALQKTGFSDRIREQFGDFKIEIPKTDTRTIQELLKELTKPVDTTYKPTYVDYIGLLYPEKIDIRNILWKIPKVQGVL